MTAILSLSLISGPEQMRLETRVIEGYEFTLGRGQDADWSLVDPETNILSRRHCMLSQEDGDWWLLDMSGNGTFLNHEREPIGDGGRRRLRDGDRIRLGVYEFQAQLTDAAPARPSFQAGADPWPSSRDTMDGPIGAMVPPPAGAAAGGGPSLGFANPFADEDEEPAAPVRPMPAVSPPAGRSGNPFADLPDDAVDDGWPSPGVTPAPPSAAPPSAAPSSAPPWSAAPASARPSSAPPLSAAPPLAWEQGNPFADGPEASGLSAPEPRPARRPTAWLSEPPPVAANPFAEPSDALAVDEPAEPVVRIADARPPEDQSPAPGPAIGDPIPAPVLPPRHVTQAAPAPIASTPTAPTSTTPTPTAPVPVAPNAGGAAAPADAVLLRALLRGAGIPDAVPRDPEQSFLALGAAFRAMMTGLRQVQRARRTVRGGFRIAQTAFTENPLKLALDENDALEALLGAGRRSAMPPARAVEEVLREIVLHEIATAAAMQEAARSLLASLAPDKLREIAEQGAGLTVLPAQRKARAWDTYEATHARVTAALLDDFDSVFGKAFARAYERVIAEQKE